MNSIMCRFVSERTEFNKKVQRIGCVRMKFDSEVEIGVVKFDNVGLNCRNS